MVFAHSCRFFHSHSSGLRTIRFFRGISQDKKTERGVEVLPVDNSAVMVKAREAEKEGPHVICNRGTYPRHGVNWGSEEEVQRTSILHMFISQSFYLVLRVAGITALGSIKLESVTVPNREPELVPEI